MIRIGVSSCLLGERVRYDGGHKLDRYITDTLGSRYQLVGICPEHEAGMPVPREPMRLVGQPDAPRLVTVTTNLDLTKQMQDYCTRRLDQLEGLGLRGCILKSRSPSCGIGSAPLFDEQGQPTGTTCSGLFAAALQHRFPDLPVVDEEQCLAAVF